MKFLEKLLGTRDVKKVEPMETAATYAEKMSDRNIAWAQQSGNKNKSVEERPNFAQEMAYLTALQAKERREREGEKANRRVARAEGQAELAKWKAQDPNGADSLK